MLGTNTDDSVANFEGLNGIENAVQYIQSIRERMLNSGEYKVLDTDIPVYGFDENGNGIQSQADVVLVSNDGQIMLIDVRSSYSSQLEQKMKSGILAYHSDKTMMQIEQEHMRDINVALYDLFGANVLGTYVFPFVIDRVNNFIKADKIFQIETLDFNKPVTPYYNKSNEEISSEVVKPLQDKVNELKEDYQQLLDSITEAGDKKYSDSHAFLDTYDIFKEGSNKDELLLQIRDLYSAIESIQSLKEDAQMRLNQLLQPKQHENTVPEFYPEDAFDHVIVDEQYQAGLDTIHEICKNLTLC